MGMFGKGFKTFMLGTDEIRRRELEKQQAEAQGLTEELATRGVPISDPRWGAAAARADASGAKVGGVMDWAKATAPKAPMHIEGPDGIYEIAPGQEPHKVVTYPARPNTTPGQIDPVTGKWQWAPGYLESQQALTGARRDAVVARPMPRTGRAPSAHAAAAIKWD